MSVCFAYCDPVGNPTMYADLLLKRAFIDRGCELAEAYYERAQLYAAKGDTEKQNADLKNSLKFAG